MKVLSEELLVHLGSYPRGANGDERVEAAETRLMKMSCKCAGRNVSEVRASPEIEIAGVELIRKQRRPLRWIRPRINMWIHLPTGVMGAARTQALPGDTGDLHGMRAQLANGRPESGSMQESEGLIVPRKSVNADGGKGPWFRVRFGEPRIWGSA